MTDLFGKATAIAPPRSFSTDDYIVASKKKDRSLKLAAGEQYEDEDGKRKVKGGKKRARPKAEAKPENDDSQDSATATSDSATAEPSKTTSDEESRTIFIGNLPPSIKKAKLVQLFKKFGDVESARVRGLPSSSISSKESKDLGHALPPGRHGDVNLQKKVVSIKSTVSSTDVTSVIGYVVFKKPEGFAAALASTDDITVDGNTLNVDGIGSNARSYEPEKTVFIGNLPYASSEDTLRNHVTDLLDSESSCIRVRLVRDKDTRRCSGTGYALLSSKEAVASILRTGLGAYKKKDLRVEVCGKRTKKKKKPVFKSAGVKSAQAGGGRRVLGNLKRKGALGDKAKQVHKRKKDPFKHPATLNGAGAGVSKRKITEKKVNDRVKKLEKRVKKGMGSQKASKKK